MDHLDLRREDVLGVRLRDYWYGMSEAAPFEARYELRPDAKRWVGVAYFCTGHHPPNDPPRHEMRLNTTVPNKAIDRALELLNTAPFVRGTYEPAILHTDDFPEISLVLELRERRIELWTESRGDDHIPWGLRIDGVEHVVASPHPSQAIGALNPYLARAKFRALIARASRR